MEEQTPTPANPDTASSAPTAVPDATKRAWSVNVVVPKPEDMPSDRLQARAQLVRSALTCGGSTY